MRFGDDIQKKWEKVTTLYKLRIAWYDMFVMDATLHDNQYLTCFTHSYWINLSLKVALLLNKEKIHFSLKWPYSNLIKLMADRTIKKWVVNEKNGRQIRFHERASPFY